MRRAWLLVLLIAVSTLSGCIAPRLSSKSNDPPAGSYGTLAVTVERPGANASASFLESLFFPRAHAVDSGQRMVRIAVTDPDASIQVSRDVLAEGRRVSATMRVPARPAYKVVAAEYYIEWIDDIWVTRITDVGTSYPITVGTDVNTLASVTLSSTKSAINPTLTVDRDRLTAVAGEEVITGTFSIVSDLNLAGFYVVSMTRDDPYCVKVAELSGGYEDESGPHYHVDWTIRPIIFDHTDKITCRFAFMTEIVDARPGGFGREEDPFLYLLYPEEPPYLEVMFLPPSMVIDL